MFNFLKLFLTLSFIKYHKKNIIAIVVTIIMSIIAVFVIGDILKIVPRDERLLVFTIKWSLLFIFTMIVLYNFRKIFKSKQQKNTVDVKKEKIDTDKKSNHKDRILNSENIESKGEQILNKYRKDKE